MRKEFALKGICLALSVIIAMAFASCSDSGSDPAEDSNTIKIGVLLSITGTGAPNAVEAQAALEIALNEINEHFKNKNSNLKIKLLIEDTKSDTVVCLEKLKQFKANDIKFVIGPCLSSELAAVKDYADQNDMLLLTHSATAISLAIPNDNVFRLTPCDSIQAKAMVKMLDHSSISAIVSLIRNDLWASELNSATQKLFIEDGGRANKTVSFGPNNTYGFEDIMTDVDAGVKGLKLNYNHNELDIACYFLSMDEGVKYLRIAKNYEDLKQVRWFGGDAFAMNEQVLLDEDAVEFCYQSQLCCPVFALDPNSKSRWSPLSNMIKAKIGREPSSTAINAYDALWLYALAYEKAGKEADFPALKNAFLSKSKNFDGASGIINFNENGDRSNANYEFWSIMKNGDQYAWTRTAIYYSASDALQILN